MRFTNLGGIANLAAGVFGQSDDRIKMHPASGRGSVGLRNLVEGRLYVSTGLVTVEIVNFGPNHVVADFGYDALELLQHLQPPDRRAFAVVNKWGDLLHSRIARPFRRSSVELHAVLARRAANRPRGLSRKCGVRQRRNVCGVTISNVGGLKLRDLKLRLS